MFNKEFTAEDLLPLKQLSWQNSNNPYLCKEVSRQNPNRLMVSLQVQNRFIVKTAGPSSCDVTAYTGVHFKKFFMLAGKIRSGALAEVGDSYLLGWLPSGI